MARPRQFDEEQVIRAVRDQFWDAGYAATSLEDLVRVSGLGKGSLYGAFGDKHRLFLRALREYTDTSCGYLREMLASTPRALDALRAFVMAPVGDPGGAAARRGCLMANSTSELATADPDVLAEARRTYEATTALVAECVGRAQDEGDLPRDVDPVETARALLAAQQGLVFMGRTGMDIDTLTRTARTLAATLLPGS
ncbi:TetR/AcrR family transcriptional regulator [Micromonospora sp. DH14]|uniref:TetR/AcrR family transcriptional regulator n=1 Tax=Micromonospora sp. DH14 TaxID=3040120 RepID=UPI00244253BB|nr:TetR/AcrR family transcriptional regulator [Micromonospora sp. DH14]MDG9674156.1 TetR/AcrR family transcriptional regulator [Micromonospora sp. DH14]